MHSRVTRWSPVLLVADLQRSMDFYVKKLGFQDPKAWGEPPCFAMMDRNGFDLMLSVAATPEQVQPHGPDGVWDLYIVVRNLDEEIAAIQAAGLELARGPELTFYKNREIEVLDPDGHRICLAEDLSLIP
jgi:catechol 2,3-dioxygenase-like lactoylglutathione lyase family enzyme